MRSVTWNNVLVIGFRDAELNEQFRNQRVFVPFEDE